jgi:hypothetical protein
LALEKTIILAENAYVVERAARPGGCRVEFSRIFILIFFLRGRLAIAHGPDFAGAKREPRNCTKIARAVTFLDIDCDARNFGDKVRQS